MDQKTYNRLTKEERESLFFEWLGETREEYSKRFEGLETREKMDLFKKDHAAYDEAFENEHGFSPRTTWERIFFNGIGFVIMIITVLVLGGMVLFRFLAPIFISFFKYGG